MKINFITYGNNAFKLARERIVKEAKNTKWFDNAKYYTENDLTLDFKQKYKTILSQPMGAGYWLWKYNIIKQSLQDMNTNDILVYCDAGCSINVNGEKRFLEYVDLIKNSDKGLITFSGGGIGEKIYTIKQIFDYFSIKEDSDIVNSGIRIAGVLIMKKNDHLNEILNTFIEVVNHDNKLITDFYNKKNQYKELKIIDMINR